MIETFSYTCIKEVLNRSLRHPLLKKLTLEDAIYYTLDFIRLIGLGQIYERKEDIIEIKDYRSLLPCDCIKVHAIKDAKTGFILKQMIAQFSAPHNRNNGIPAYRISGDIIYTNFEHGKLIVSYDAIKVDDEGLPMIPDDPAFIKALELYIKKEWFTILSDIGEMSIRDGRLTNAQMDYASAVAMCRAKFNTPSPAEMELIGSIMNRMLPTRKHIHNGLSNIHNGEIIKTHSPNE